MTPMDDLITKARALMPFTGVRWEDHLWKIDEPGFHGRAHRHVQSLWFSDLESTEVHHDADKRPLPPAWMEFAKAAVARGAANTNRGIGPTLVLLATVRVLESLWHNDHSLKGPADLRLRHFEAAELFGRERYSAGYAYRFAGKLTEISELLDAFEVVTPRINFRHRTPRPSSERGIDESSRRQGEEKLPSPESLEALADISANPRDDYERIIIRNIDLLVAGGFRVGEVLTLPVDCWVEKRVGGKLACGIRYQPQKGGEPDTKWLPRDSAGMLARRAIDELRQLCAPAREAAARLESRPDQLAIFDPFRGSGMITLPEVAALVGYREPAAAGSALRAMDVLVGKQISVAELEAAFLSRRWTRSIHDRDDGTPQHLSQTLTVIFLNQFHSRKPTYRFLARPLTVQNINDALGSSVSRRELTPSMFRRRGLDKVNGVELRLNSHAPRHWLNMLLDQGGLGELEQARWMGRTDIGQNAVYQHKTQEQLKAGFKEMVRNRKVTGSIVDTYEDLPAVEREAFLDGQVQAVHVTTLGGCVRNYAQGPCPHHVSCLRGCGDYLRVKGDQGQRAELVKLLEASRRIKDRMLRELGPEVKPGASTHLTHLQQVIDNTTRALAIDDARGVPKGTPVKVFEGNPSLFVNPS